MKQIKICLIILVVSIMIDSIIAIASTKALTERIVTTYIPAGKQSFTGYVQKINYRNQKYYNNFTNTPITSPCPNCPIGVKWEGANGSTERTIYMGQTKMADLTSLYEPGMYRLGFRRTDMTFLETYTSGTWTHN